MKIEPTVDYAMHILNERGDLNKEGIAPRIIYEDAKVLIESLVDPIDLKFRNLAIMIKMKNPGSDRISTGFGLESKNDEDWTQVLFWEYRDNVEVKVPSFLRPGKWMKYVEQIGLDCFEKRKQLLSRHRMPINDGELFPDIE